MERTIQIKAAMQFYVVNMLLEDVDDDEDLFLLRMLHDDSKNKRICVQNYVSGVVTHYSDPDFKSHFRVDRTTYQYLLELIGPEMVKNNTPSGGRPCHPIDKQFLIAVWMLSNTEVYRSVADRFDVSKSTAWEYVNKVSRILVQRANTFIKWPQGIEAQESIHAFEERNGFPGIIGAIDGCHIPIMAPSYEPDSYFNRNKYHSIVLQAVVNHKGKFIDCTAGSPGRVHDARVYRNSDLRQRIIEHGDEMCPFDSHILGDSAYSNTSTLLVPFKDNGHMTQKQRHYNHMHSSNRVIIERGFAMLVGRFRRLKMVNMSRTDLIPQVILACCVLHNICIDLDDMIEPDNQFEPLQCNNILNQLDEDRRGVDKREQIANLLWERR